MKKQIMFSVILMMVFSVICLGDIISFDVDFDPRKISLEPRDGYHELRYMDSNSYSFVKAGDPDIPAYIIRVLVPSGSEITDVRTNPQGSINLGKVLLFPYQGQHPISLPAPEFTGPNKQVYASGLIFPSERVIPHSTGKTRGFDIYYFSYIPFEYNTSSGELFFYEEASFEIEFDRKKEIDAVEYRANKVFNEMVMSSVINPEDLFRFYPSKVEPDERLTDYDMLIITTDTLKTAVQTYANYRETSAGITSYIKTVSEIESEYSGSTTQLKIKYCVYDYVQNSNITYVFLVGDGGTSSEYSVPDQNVYGSASYYTDNTIPGDIFYSCFDNQFDWNADGDSRVGEMSVDNADISPDVIIGRLAVRTSQQVTDYMNKISDYTAASTDPSFIENLLLSGVQLWNPGDAEAKSEKMYNEFIEPNWDYHQKNTLYDSVTTVSVDTLSAKLNESMNFFHMATHGNVTIWGMGTGSDFNSNHALALNNTPGTAITIACITNAFDPEVDGASDPCLGEAFIRNPNGGSVVYIGAARYGWGTYDINEHGVSFQYNDRIFQHMLQDTFDHKIGSAFTQAKIDLVGQANSDGVFRWVHFALIHGGDPTLIAYKEVEGAVAPPSNFTAEGVSTSQINLSWQKNDDNNDVMVIWSLDGVFGTPLEGVNYNVGNSIPGGGTVLYKGSAESHSHTGLNSSTRYYYRAFSYNALLEYSAGRSTNTVTFCDIIDTLPFFEDFNYSTELPMCWEIVDHQGNGQVWAFGTVSQGLSGTTGNYAYVDSDGYGYSGTQNTDLITPVLDLSNYTGVEVSFTHYFRQYSSSSGTFSYSTDNGANWTDVQSWSSTSGNPIYFSQAIPGVDGESTVRFRWHYQGSWDYYWCVDDILVDGDLSGDVYTVSLSSDPDGIGATLTGAGNYLEGANVNISASHSGNYNFVEWTGTAQDLSLLSDPSSASASFTMPARNVAFTAVFEEISTYTVSLSSDPDGIGATLTGAGNYLEGANVNISASHSGNYNFVEWTGTAQDVALLSDPSSSSASFTMPSRNVAFTAVFEQIPVYAVSLYADPDNIGVVLTGAGNYIAGANVAISASYSGDYSFVEWTGTAQDVALLSDPSSSSASFTMPARNVAFTAVYEDNSQEPTVPVYRFFNTVRGGHLYTISEVERDYIMENLPQWSYEGIKFAVYEHNAPGSTAAYRFFNTNTGIHLYTISEEERDNIMELPQWNYEGIKFYVHEDQAQDSIPVFRFFNHARGGHLYTISEIERDAVMELPQWTYEGIPFYVFPYVR